MYLIELKKWRYKMVRVRLLLTLITLAIAVGPLAGVIIVYQNNLLGLIVPPELMKIMKGNFVTGESLQPPKFVGSQYDLTSRTGKKDGSLPNGARPSKKREHRLQAAPMKSGHNR